MLLGQVPSPAHHKIASVVANGGGANNNNSITTALTQLGAHWWCNGRSKAGGAGASHV